MLNTSNEYKQYIADSVNSTLSRDFTARADIELADSTVLNVTEGDIVVKGLKISDATSPNNSFQIGSAIIGQCVLMLSNIGGKFDQYDFTDAVIRPYIGLRLSETTEWLRKGVFTVDEPTLASSVISLVALDNMNKFDTPFSEVAISFPCTALQLLQAVCLHCEVSLEAVSFTNSDFIITRKPDDEATTCREIVAWIAQLSGNYARCNTNGALELKWYDISAFEQADNLDGGIFDSSIPYSSGGTVDGGDFTFSEPTNYDGGTFLQAEKYHHIYALNQAIIGTDDVVIAGIQVKAQGMESDYGETVLFGSTGYVIEITNPLIQENTANTIATSVGAKIVGMKFRPLSVSALSDPSIEAGDVAYVSDRKGNSYQTLITNLSYTIGNLESISCDAETPSKKQSVRFDPSTKAIVEARKAAKKEISQYDLVVKQFQNLMTYGFGLYPSEEVLEDGSIIYYMHDKPTIAESNAVWKFNENGLFLSTDNGLTWGVDTNGNMLVNVLTAVGINADWIIAGLIASANNSSWFDLDNNSFSYGNGALKYSPVNGFELKTPNTKINNSGGLIGGWEIAPSGLKHNSSETFGPFTQADQDRVQQLVLGNISPTQADFTKYDINRNGIFDSLDLASIQAMRAGTKSYTRNYEILINSQDANKMIETKVTDSVDGSVLGTNKFGANSINTSYLIAKQAFVEFGANGSFQTADGKNVVVKGGIVTSII